MYKFDDRKIPWSWDSANIDFSDYIKRYGNGRVWNVGSLFREDADKITMRDIISNAELIKLIDLSKIKKK